MTALVPDLRPQPVEDILSLVHADSYVQAISKCLDVFDILILARNPAEQTCRSVEAMLVAAASGPLTIQFVMERGLPPETVRAVVETVRRFNIIPRG